MTFLLGGDEKGGNGGPRPAAGLRAPGFLPKMELARSMLKRENESLFGRPGKIQLEERLQCTGAVIRAWSW